jgi:hypothetical protein
MMNARSVGRMACNTSRRRLIAGCVAALAVSLPKQTNSQASKIPQSTAGYQGSPNGGQSCSGCTHFVAPASCALVDGSINPQGWCKLFAKKG